MSTLTTVYDENGNPQPAELTAYFFGGAYETTLETGAVRKYYSFAGQRSSYTESGRQLRF